MDFKEAIKNRRSYYDISSKSTITDEEIKELVEYATKYTPSAYNSQSQAVTILLGEKHDKLWDITVEALRPLVPANKFSATEAKINSFKSGYGTILYWSDDNITKELQKNNPLYADNFPIWGEQASAMLQLVIWTMLEERGLGATLQHYNPLIDKSVKMEFNISKNMSLIAQMPFGIPTSQPAEKEFIDISTRVKLLK